MTVSNQFWTFIPTNISISPRKLVQGSEIHVTGWFAFCRNHQEIVAGVGSNYLQTEVISKTPAELRLPSSFFNKPATEVSVKDVVSVLTDVVFSSPFQQIPSEPTDTELALQAVPENRRAQLKALLQQTDDHAGNWN